MALYIVRHEQEFRLKRPERLPWWPSCGESQDQVATDALFLKMVIYRNNEKNASIDVFEGKREEKMNIPIFQLWRIGGTKA